MYKSNSFSFGFSALGLVIILLASSAAQALPPATGTAVENTGSRLLADSLGLAANSTRQTNAVAVRSGSIGSNLTFGSLDPIAIDLATATLDIFDAVPIADRAIADGVKTVGDGRVLAAFFEPGVIEDGSLIIKAVALNNQSAASTGTVPEPGTLVLLALGLVSLVVARNRA